jgi:hypothetical protein
MIIAYSYIGPLPEYTLDTIYQTRLFFKGPIYFIISDLSSPIVTTLENQYDVTVIPYKTVVDHEFNDCVAKHINKFTILEGLKGRELLFIYAFERFFVLHQLMRQQQLSNVFFMELDNLIYNDPLKWEERFCDYEMSIMFDNYERCSSGICYIKNTDILSRFCQRSIQYIVQTDITKQFMTEMQSLEAFWKENPLIIQILPTHWPSPHVPPPTYERYHCYQNSVFDSAGLGIYFGGIDPIHTNGMIMTGLRSIWSAIDYTPNRFEWKKDEEERLIPYVVLENQWIRINNLHIHSKQLRPHLSKEFTHNQN